MGARLAGASVQLQRQQHGKLSESWERKNIVSSARPNGGLTRYTGKANMGKGKVNRSLSVERSKLL